MVFSHRLLELWSSPSARLVPILKRSKALARPSRAAEGRIDPVLLRPAARAADMLGVSDFDAVFLGLGKDGSPFFAVPVSEEK
eukprot:scaffold654101_cov42-Prasinocladus_malaysianus.AAC.1